MVKINKFVFEIVKLIDVGSYPLLHSSLLNPQGFGASLLTATLPLFQEFIVTSMSQKCKRYSLISDNLLKSVLRSVLYCGLPFLNSLLLVYESARAFLIASVPSTSNVPTYTFPNAPDPIKQPLLKLLVALTNSSI